MMTNSEPGGPVKTSGRQTVRGIQRGDSHRRKDPLLVTLTLQSLARFVGRRLWTPEENRTAGCGRPQATPQTVFTSALLN